MKGEERERVQKKIWEGKDGGRKGERGGKGGKKRQWEGRGEDIWPTYNFE